MMLCMEFYGIPAASGLYHGTQSQSCVHWLHWHVLQAVESIPVYTDIPSMSSVHDAVRLDKPRVVVLGSGWAAASFMKALPKQIKYAPQLQGTFCLSSSCSIHYLTRTCRLWGFQHARNHCALVCCPSCAVVRYVACRAKYEVVVVSPRNYFLYTPLLPAVAVGTMEERRCASSSLSTGVGAPNSKQQHQMQADALAAGVVQQQTTHSHDGPPHLAIAVCAMFSGVVQHSYHADLCACHSLVNAASWSQ